MKVLQINSSIQGPAGQSTILATQLARELGDDIVVRDLVAEPIPHLTAERFAAFLAKPAERTAAQQVVVEESDALINELREAEVIVLGLPMYNYGVPSQLKAWFDHVARAGVTFRYTEKGPQGLITGKKVYVISTRGGLYAGTARDSETVHVREFLALLGLTDVEFIYAEGLAMGDTVREPALAQARERVTRIAQPIAFAA